MSAARKPNAWFEAVLECHGGTDTWDAINPRDNPETWTAWRNYFKWLNWAPYWFREVERRFYEDKYATASFTVPVDHPDKLIPKFKPAPSPPYDGSIFFHLEPIPPPTPENKRRVQQSLERFRRDMAARGKSRSPAARVVEQAAQAILKRYSEEAGGAL